MEVFCCRTVCRWHIITREEIEIRRNIPISFPKLEVVRWQLPPLGRRDGLKLLRGHRQ